MAALQVLTQQLLGLAAQTARLRLAWRMGGRHASAALHGRQARPRPNAPVAARMREPVCACATAHAASAEPAGPRPVPPPPLADGTMAFRRFSKSAQMSSVCNRTQISPNLETESKQSAQSKQSAGGAHRAEDLLQLSLEHFELFHVRALRRGAASATSVRRANTCRRPRRRLHRCAGAQRPR